MNGHEPSRAIRFEGQHRRVVTAAYRESAREAATEVGFPRIGLINGRQLVDLLVQYWASIPDEFKGQLDLKLGLVRG